MTRRTIVRGSRSISAGVPAMRVLAMTTSAALVVAACGGVGSPSGSADVGRTVRIEMSDFAFSPSTITVKPGERIALSFRNVGTVEHEFMVGTDAVAGKGYLRDWLADAELDRPGTPHAKGHAGEGVRVSPRGTALLTILVPPLVGEFEFGCFVEGHYESGMKGTLLVSVGAAPNAVPEAQGSARPSAWPTPAPGAPTASPHSMDSMEGEGH